LDETVLSANHFVGNKLDSLFNRSEVWVIDGFAETPLGEMKDEKDLQFIRAFLLVDLTHVCLGFAGRGEDGGSIAVAWQHTESDVFAIFGVAIETLKFPVRYLLGSTGGHGDQPWARLAFAQAYCSANIREVWDSKLSASLVEL